MPFAILPNYHPTRSCVSTRSSLYSTATLVYPLAPYVAAIALLPHLLDPPFLLQKFDQELANGSKKMLTDFSIRAVRDAFFHHLHRTIAGAHIRQVEVY